MQRELATLDLHLCLKKKKKKIVVDSWPQASHETGTSQKALIPASSKFRHFG